MRDKRTNCEFMPAGGWTAALNKILCNRPRGPLRYPRDRGTNCEFMPAAAWTVAREEIPRNRPRGPLRCARDRATNFGFTPAGAWTAAPNKVPSVKSGADQRLVFAFSYTAAVHRTAATLRDLRGLR